MILIPSLFPQRLMNACKNLLHLAKMHSTQNFFEYFLFGIFCNVFLDITLILLLKVIQQISHPVKLFSRVKCLRNVSRGGIFILYVTPKRKQEYSTANISKNIARRRFVLLFVMETEKCFLIMFFSAYLLVTYFEQGLKFCLLQLYFLVCYT